MMALAAPAILIPEFVETARLRLSRPLPDDWEGLHPYYSDEECARYTFGKAMTESETRRILDALDRHWRRHGYGPYVLRELAGDAVVGLVGLWFPREWPETEIKWAIIRQHWGKGYASEAARAVQALLPSCLPGMQPISLIHAENRRSIALALALGATLEECIEFRNAPFHRYRHRPHPG